MMLSIVKEAELGFSEQDLESPLLSQKLYFYAKGEEIPLFAEGVWQVTQGLVQLKANYGDGEQVLFGWVPTGSWFGNHLEDNLDYQAVALAPTHLRWLRWDEIESSLHLSQILLPQLAKRMHQAELLLIINGRRASKQRLRGLLSLFRRELGECVSDDRTRIICKFTHQQLANAIGTTRVTVSRLMTYYQSQGYMSLDRNRYLILDNNYFGNVGN